MKRFEFKLQRLLDLRISQEQAIKAELSQLIAKQNEEVALQESYKEKINSYYSLLSSKMKDGSFSYSEALMCERFVYFATKAIEASQKRVQKLQPEIEKVRQKLIEAQKARKIVERLKEKKLEEYMYLFHKEMGNELDDMNQRLYNNTM